MSLRRKLVLSLLGVAALLIGAATLWQGNDGGVPRHARVLLLDPSTGTTLHEWQADGGYAVVALLAGGRVAVATEDSCPGGKGGHLTVLDRTLARVISSRKLSPCTVARIDSTGLRALLGRHDTGPRAIYHGDRGVSIRLGRGTIAETYTHYADTSAWLTGIAAFDASARVRWRRSDLGRIGIADARGGRLVVPVFGTFTPGSD